MTRNLTRRALVAGIAASSVAAIPAFASPAASGDADLLRLESELALAGVEFNRIDEARVEALGKLPDWARLSTPKYPIGHPLFRNMGRQYADNDDCLTIKAIRNFNRNTESIVEDWRDMATSPVRDKRRAEWLNRRAEGRKRVAWWHDQAAAIEAENVRAGIPGLTDAMDRANELEGEIQTAIRDLPARGPAGIAVKIRLALRLNGNAEDNPDWVDKINLSVLRDLDRLAGKGGAS